MRKYLLSCSVVILASWTNFVFSSAAEAKTEKRAPETSSDSQNASLQEEIATLKAQMEVMMKRINELQAREVKRSVKHKKAIAPTKSTPAPTKTNTIVEAHKKTPIKTGGDTFVQQCQDKSSAPKGKAPVVSTGETVKVSVYGHVNRAMLYGDNGYDRELKHVDNNVSSTRLGVKAEANVSEALTVGGNILLEYLSDSSHNTDLLQAQSSQDLLIRHRILEAYISSKIYGKLALGRGDTATSRIMDLDLSGTNVAQEGLEIPAVAGGIRYGWAPTVNVPGGAPQRSTTLSISQTHSELFVSERLNRVLYESPSFNGFVLSIAHINQKRFDMALRYAAEFKKIQLIAAGGWYHDPDPVGAPASSPGNFGNVAGANLTGVDRFGGSMAVLFPNGISFNGGYTVQKNKVWTDVSRKDSVSWGGKAGYQQKFFEVGKTCFALGYFRAKNIYMSAVDPLMFPNGAQPAQRTMAYDADDRNDSRVFGFYIVQNMDKWGSEIYFSYQNHELTGTRLFNGAGVPQNTFNTNITLADAAAGWTIRSYTFKPIHSYVLGMRVKF
ncbi:MAG: hypothetical protein ACTHJ4_07635 [Candidatus Nucleicultricaceae bacterium]